jgi:hypothetical protein
MDATPSSNSSSTSSSAVVPTDATSVGALLPHEPQQGAAGFRERARAAFRRGADDLVRELSHTELQRARRDGDQPAEVEAQYMLARLAIRSGDLTSGRELAQEALSVALRTGDRRLEERPRHVLAAVARMAGDLPLARRLYQDSIALNQELGHAEHVNSEYHNLAYTELHLGEIERARRLFEDGRRRVLAGGLDDFLPYVLGAAAVMAGVDGDQRRAARLLGLTDAAFRALGQVPDPDDAAELDAARTRAAAELSPAVFAREHAAGRDLDAHEELRRG